MLFLRPVLFFTLVLGVNGFAASPPLESIDCCRCDDRYTQESRVTWYGAGKTCEKQPIASLTCRRIRVQGHSCETTRWVPGPEGRICQKVDLVAIEDDGKTHPLKLQSMSPCDAGLALKAAKSGGGVSGGGGGPGGQGGGGAAVAGQASSNAYCNCSQDPHNQANCALFHTEGGQASTIDSKPLPEGYMHCDRQVCSQLFSSHSAQCPAYYEGAPAQITPAPE